MRWIFLQLTLLRVTISTSSTALECTASNPCHWELSCYVSLHPFYIFENNYMMQCPLSELTGDLFLNFTGCPHFDTLYLYGGSIQRVPENAIVGHPPFTALTIQNSNFTGILNQEDLAGIPDTVQIVELNSNEITGMYHALPATVKHLNVRDNLISSVSDLVLPSVEKLFFSGDYTSQGTNPITSLEDDDFAGLTSLLELYLHHLQIISISQHAFRGLDLLTHLDLHCEDLSIFDEYNCTSLNSILPARVFSGLTQLTSLDLRGTGITYFGSELFYGLSSLQTIDLRDNSFEDFHVSAFQGCCSASNTTVILALQLNACPLGSQLMVNVVTDYDLTLVPIVVCACNQFGYSCSTSGGVQPCPRGTYSDNAPETMDSISQCQECQPGYYNTLEGQAFCPFPCPSGTYLAESGASSADQCIPCPSGAYCFGNGNIAGTQVKIRLQHWTWSHKPPIRS